MRKILKTVFVFGLPLALLVVAGCTKVCDVGLEGPGCKTAVRTKFLGQFSGTETCGSAVDTFSMAFVGVAQDSGKLLIVNIYNTGLNAYGTALANGSIAIVPQSFGNNGTISGVVAFNSNSKIRVDYLVKIPGLTDAGCAWVQN